MPPPTSRFVRRTSRSWPSRAATRLIIVDGSEYGRKPVTGFADLRVGASTRGYDPFQLTLWKAEWVDGSSNWPLPVWP